jgi:hypothetical protein
MTLMGFYLVMNVARSVSKDMFFIVKIKCKQGVYRAIEILMMRFTLKEKATTCTGFLYIFNEI